MQHWMHAVDHKDDDKRVECGTHRIRNRKHYSLSFSTFSTSRQRINLVCLDFFRNEHWLMGKKRSETNIEGNQNRNREWEREKKKSKNWRVTLRLASGEILEVTLKKFGLFSIRFSDKMHVEALLALSLWAFFHLFILFFFFFFFFHLTTDCIYEVWPNL